MKNIELVSAAEMPAADRAAEIVAILAAAIFRSIGTQQSKPDETGLGFLVGGSVHTTPYQEERL